MEAGLCPFGELIKRISTIYEKRANSDMQSREVTVSQMKMLVILSQSQEQTLPLKELERYFGVAQSTAAGVAVRLEKKGLVSPATDPADRRIKRLQLTKAGKALCDDSRAEMERFDDRMLACLTQDERQQLLELLERIYDAVKTP